MEVLFFAVADSAAIDVGTNRVSIFNLLEQISSTTYPGVYPSMTVMAIASRERTEPSLFNLTIRIGMKGQEPFVNSGLVMDFQDRIRARSLGQIAGLSVPSPGVLRFELLQEGNLLSSWETIVERVGEPTFVQQPTGPTGPSAPNSSEASSNQTSPS